MWIVHNNEQTYQGLILDSMATFWSILLLSSPSSCSPLLFISNLYSLSSFLTSSSHSMTSVLLKKSVTDFCLNLNIYIFSTASLDVVSSSSSILTSWVSSPSFPASGLVFMFVIYVKSLLSVFPPPSSFSTLLEWSHHPLLAISSMLSHS